MSRVLICGSRHYNSYADFCVELNKIHKEFPISHIIHGGAKGTDSMAQCWAGEHHVHTRIEYPDWDKYGEGAGPIRNRKMLEQNPDLVVAFLAPNSIGTKDMIKAATKAGIEVRIFNV